MVKLGFALVGQAFAQQPGDVCIGQCRALSADGCCKYDGGSDACTWCPLGHVDGGSSISTSSASANCRAGDQCDGWNWGQDCGGSCGPVPSPSPSPTPSPSPSDWTLAWADEFDSCPNGVPDPNNWDYELGYKRNNEQQWYQKENAVCSGGSLVISARREHPSDKPSFEYTSSSLVSRGRQEWTYGRFEMRARIPIAQGSWPAWWTLGDNGLGWPSNGEIDIMEYYRGNDLANFCFGNKDNQGVWNSVKTPVDDAWASQFHVWAMEWDETEIKLFLDDKMVNHQLVSSADGTGHLNPWRGHPQYMILNLAIGGQNGGDPSQTQFPLVYEIDYVRVYQQAPALVAVV